MSAAQRDERFHQGSPRVAPGTGRTECVSLPCVGALTRYAAGDAAVTTTDSASKGGA
jgi:hypothetical protein